MGKMNFFSNRVRFDLVLFGTESKARVSVTGNYNKQDKQWLLANVIMKTK